MTWLKKIAVLIKKIPKDFQPEIHKIEKGEKVIGMLPPNLVNLSKLIRWLSNNSVAEAEEHQKICQGGDSCTEFHRKLILARNESQTIKEILFTSIYYEMGIDPLNDPSLGIREGNIVVSIPREKRNAIEIIEVVGPIDPMSVIRGKRRPESDN